MLVVTRKIGQRVRIGDLGVVTITSVRGRRVQVGFEFPREVRVMREEVQTEEKKDASGTDDKKKA